MHQPSLFDPMPTIEQPDRNILNPHRRLQLELPADLKGWELFFQRLGGRNTYFCINFDHTIITARHPTSQRAVDEAFTYAIIYELLPIPTLELLHPGRWLPAHYRDLIIANERRTRHVQSQPRLAPDEPLPG